MERFRGGRAGRRLSRRARASGTNASRLSEAVRRLEAQLGIRPHTTRSVAPTQAVRRSSCPTLFEQAQPILHTKAGNFNPATLLDDNEDALTELLKHKQAEHLFGDFEILDLLEVVSRVAIW